MAWHYVGWVPVVWTAVAWAGAWLGKHEGPDLVVVVFATAPGSLLVMLFNASMGGEAPLREVASASLWVGPAVIVALALPLAALRVRARWFVLLWLVHSAALFRFALGAAAEEGVSDEEFGWVLSAAIPASLNLGMVGAIVLTIVVTGGYRILRRTRGA